MDSLNYHHLRYFREVAREGGLNRAATRLNLSQSALSAQIKTLEERIGHPLFDRVGRSLALTEVGRLVLDHADRIFSAGEELLATLQQSRLDAPPLRVGAVSTLSRNFQMRFLQPALADPDLQLVLRSGGDTELYEALKALSLDVALTTEPPPGAYRRDFVSHLIAEQPVRLHGPPDRLNADRLDADRPVAALIAEEPLIIPSESSIRLGFESLAARLGVRPRIVAEVDDMAMLRLLARRHMGLALAPSVVLADEIAAGVLAATPHDLGLMERFYAATPRRQFPHPKLSALLEGALTP
ncbi:MAG: LysR family transcriptional regulator [Pseudomonadota bacterium]